VSGRDVGQCPTYKPAVPSVSSNARTRRSAFSLIELLVAIAVENGKFDTAQLGKGVRGSSYVIRISEFDGKEALEAQFGQFLFPEYIDMKELPKADSELTFEIPKKKSSPHFPRRRHTVRAVFLLV
jgi:hypothetical protein